MKIRQMIEGATRGVCVVVDIEATASNGLPESIGLFASLFPKHVNFDKSIVMVEKDARLIALLKNNATALADLADASRAVFLEHCKDVGDHRGDGCEICVAYQKLSEEFQP